MAEVIKSIKADGTGDYTTIAAWHADLDQGTVYSAGDDAIGELYNEAYTEQASVDNGGTLGLNSVTLRAHSSARHTGRPGTGARVVFAFNPFWGANNSVTYNFEWFEYDFNQGDDSEIIALQSSATTRCRNLIVHNAVHTSTTFACYGIRCRGTSDNHEIDNCLVFNVEQTGGQRLSGILLSDSTTGKVRNCTVTDIRNTNVTSGDSQGINFLDSANHTIQNNLVTNITSTAGTAECYDNATVTSAVTAGNVSDDATSPQSGLRNATISFENAANDVYWPAPGDTDAIGVGSDLGTGQVAVDLLGRDRDAQGDTWDAGAFQYQADIPYFVGGASGSVTSGTQVTVTVSGISIQEGDVIVAVMHSNEVTGALSGDGTYTFTKDFEEQNPSIDTGLYAVFSRVATASEPSSYQFNHSGLADRNEVQLSVFRHIDTDNIWEVIPNAYSRASGDSGTTATSPAATTLNPQSIGIAVAFRDSGATTGFTAINEGYTNEVSLGTGGDQCTFMWSRMFLSSGVKPAVDATLSADDAWFIHQFALAPKNPITTRFVEAATAYVASDTTLTITHGMTIDAGDVLVALVTLSAPGTISSTGSVFTPEFQEESPVNASTQYGIFYRVATASEASSWTFTSDGAAGRISIHVLRFRGIAATVWDVAPSASTRAIKNAGTTLDTAKALTTLTDNAIGIGFIYTDDATVTYSGFTIGPFEIYHGSGQAHYEAIEHFGAAAAQTAFNATVSATDDITAQYFALKAASGGPVITDVDTDNAWDDGTNGLVINGSGFM